MDLSSPRAPPSLAPPAALDLDALSTIIVAVVLGLLVMSGRSRPPAAAAPGSARSPGAGGGREDEARAAAWAGAPPPPPPGSPPGSGRRQRVIEFAPDTADADAEPRARGAASAARGRPDAGAARGARAARRSLVPGEASTARGASDDAGRPRSSPADAPHVLARYEVAEDAPPPRAPGGVALDVDGDDGFDGGGGDDDAADGDLEFEISGDSGELPFAPSDLAPGGGDAARGAGGGGAPGGRLIEFYSEAAVVSGVKDIDFDVEDDDREDVFVPKFHQPMTYEEILNNGRSAAARGANRAPRRAPAPAPRWYDDLF